MGHFKVTTGHCVSIRMKVWTIGKKQSHKNFQRIPKFDTNWQYLKNIDDIDENWARNWFYWLPIPKYMFGIKWKNINNFGNILLIFGRKRGF